MSAFKPPKKVMKTTAGTSPLKRTASVPLEEKVVCLEESFPRIISPQVQDSQVSTTTTKRARHPKGHKVQNLQDVWNAMDKRKYLSLSDTTTLSDVWIQPRMVESEEGEIANVSFTEIIVAPYIKTREATTKISTSDLLKMLYQACCIVSDLNGELRMGFEEWSNEALVKCTKEKGKSDITPGELCQYLLTEDSEFTFYPKKLNDACGIFFRKICYHSYKDEEHKGEEGAKWKNPAMIKCQANSSSSSFEYILEASLKLIPPEWRSDDS